MAKHNKTTGNYTPGIIYYLQYKQHDKWQPFYVGETIDVAARKKSHTSSSKTDQRRVYEFIRNTLTPANIEWDLFPVDNYGSDGPRALEHEHIMALLYDNVQLKNMKKGSQNWMANQIKIADQMRQRGTRSYKKYQELLSEEKKADAQARKHAKWIEQEQTKQLQLQHTQRNCKMLAEIEQLQQELNSRAAWKAQLKAQRQSQRDAELAVIRVAQQLKWEAERDAELAVIRAAQQLKWEAEQNCQLNERNKKTIAQAKTVLATIGLTYPGTEENTSFNNLFEDTK
jgi:hypothetical protein